jgi:Holliday junction DNA helicase RuvA
VFAKLTGRLDEIFSDYLILDVQGVGYKIFASRYTLERARAQVGSFSLLIEPIIRPEHMNLYGFITASEKEWFVLLLSIPGVGARVALALLSVLRPEDFYEILGENDEKRLTLAEGVGPRLAARIFSELKSKVKDLPQKISTGSWEAMVPTPAFSHLLMALTSLGYSEREARHAMGKVTQDKGAIDSLEEGVRLCLQVLAQPLGGVAHG